MKKKNSFSIKWMLVIMIGLSAIVYGTNEISKNIATTAAPNIYSQNSFIRVFQYLAYLFGIEVPGLTDYVSSRWFHHQNFESIAFPEGGFAQFEYQRKMLANLSASDLKLFKFALAPKWLYVENFLNNAPVDASSSRSDNNTDNNSNTNSSYNPSNNLPTNNPGNSENNADINNPNNTDNNSTNSSTASNATTNSQNNNGDNTTTSSGVNPGDTSGNTNSSSDSGSPSANNPPALDPTNLPTINPIPTDDAVAQNIARQNQENNNLAAYLASRQALVVPVQETAQATKYQTIDNPNTPTPSTDTPPADVLEKMASHKYNFH